MEEANKSPMSQVFGNKNDPVEDKKPDNNPQNTFTKKFLLVIWDIFKIVVIAAAIVLPIRYFLFQPFIVKGDSMIPNFHSGDYIVVDEISYRFSSPKRGDVVVLKYPLDTTQRFIKRIIGLPGETVEIQNGKVDILKNGKDIRLNETTYLPNGLTTSGNVDVTLKPGQYFVMGDNRPYSYDSRSWGILPKDDIIGRAFLRIYPFTAMAYISAPTY
jgi:signal peptidase I